ncbi:MAG: PSD1 domain-containing protein [Bryobacterales bacterium]|nr:PSD1 domain-containing protein [Bryobacterales bacterium]
MFRILGMLVLAWPACAQSNDEFFEKRIRPVLAEKCYACHSAKSKMPMGGLRLDTAAAMRKGGDSGPAVVPGDPAKSLLLKAIRYGDLQLKMPPSGKLAPEVIADFEKWIVSGAADPRMDEPAAVVSKKGIDWDQAGQFWSFRPVTSAAPPTVKNTAWPRGAVDRFLLARLEQKGLKPAPPADRRSWIRRVTYDLTGLPPTPAEIAEYLGDASPDADRKLVERLLASPHYGERWARHWLDLVRFAETNGHEFDNDKLDAWRYRDYVIRAFNSDLPYNQFVREQIAGDLMPNKRLSPDGKHWESPLGTGIFWLWEVLNSSTDSVKSRADIVDNQIDVLGKAFLGLTVACARCHDHKFDPIPTADYYSLAGIMHSTDMRESVIDSPSHAARISEAHQRIAGINREIRRLSNTQPARNAPALKLRDGDIVFEDFEDLGYEGWIASGQAFGNTPAHEIAPNQPLNNYRGEGIANSFGAGTDRLVGSLTSRKFRMPKLWVHVRYSGSPGNKQSKERGDIRLTVVADDHKSEHFVPSGKAGFEWKSIRMTKEIGRVCFIEIVDRSRDAHIAVDKIIFSDDKEPPVLVGDGQTPQLAPLSDGVRQQIATLERQRGEAENELPESAFGMLSRDESPRNVRLHIRGSHTNLGDEMPRQFLRLVAGEKQTPVAHGSGRRELAEWMASERNPLTARVMANRIWKHHFGAGLVRSADNFGKMGEAPAHGELLDYVAAEFVRGGWSVKELHRMIVLSAAYRMSSTADEAAMRVDPRNELLHHVPVRRLEAEAIRDTVLALAGRLDRSMYGPGVPPHISKYQDGRGKPASGPLDGEGRRSIYIQVRRNFIPPLFLAFDYPLPVSTIGNRGASAVPSQALMMMNNELIRKLAEQWSARAAKSAPEADKRLDLLFEEAFGRPPEEWERKEVLGFVAGRAEAWSDLCHVLLNSAELIYVR